MIQRPVYDHELKKIKERMHKSHTGRQNSALTDLDDFLKSGYKCCLMCNINYNNATDYRHRLATEIKNSKLPVKAFMSQNNVYLERTDL